MIQLKQATQLTGWSRLAQLVDEDAARPSLMGDVEPLRAEPWRVLAPLNVVADPWQVDVLSSEATKLLLLCSRQSGKSFVMSALALLDALLHPYAEVLIISKTLRQSIELLLKVKMVWRGLTGGKVHRRGSWRPRSLAVPGLIEQQRVLEMGWDGAALIQLDKGTVDATKDKALSMTFPNGARITSLPGNPDTIVGFSAVTLLIIDEAARVSDALYNLVRPFLSATAAVHGRPGRMVVASTPYGKRGWFHEAWQSCEKVRAAWEAGRLAGQLAAQAASGWNSAGASDGPRGGSNGVVVGQGGFTGADAWLQAHWKQGWEGRPMQPPFQTFRVTADQCPRITKEFLDEERAMIGERWFAQEYQTQFVDSIDSVFSHDLVHGMVQPGEGEHKLWFE